MRFRFVVTGDGHWGMLGVRGLRWEESARRSDGAGVLSVWIRSSVGRRRDRRRGTAAWPGVIEVDRKSGERIDDRLIVSESRTTSDLLGVITGSSGTRDVRIVAGLGAVGVGVGGDGSGRGESSLLTTTGTARGKGGKGRTLFRTARSDGDPETRRIDDVRRAANTIGEGEAIGDIPGVYGRMAIFS